MKNIDKIYKIISDNNCGIRAMTILSKLESEINKTTIYRNIDKLLESWEIIQDFSASWEKIYSIKQNHHHHFVCDICKEKENIWCFLSPEIKWLENKFWFRVKNHSLVLNWVCRNCI